MIQSRLKTSCLDDDHGDGVRVTVAGRPPVLQVPIALLGHIPRDPDACTTIGNTGREVVDGGGFMTSSQPPLVILASMRIILLDMKAVILAQLLNSSLDVHHAALFSHSLSREVTMSPRTIPVSNHGLGIKGDYHTKVFSNSFKKKSCHPEIITHVNSLSWPNLELPLSRHHLRISPRNSDASVQAAPVMSLNNVPAVNSAGANTTVVRSLGSRK